MDEKNRISIPSEVRRALDAERDGDAFFILIGVNLKPWLYPERMYENLVSQSASQLAPGEDDLLFDQLNFGLVQKAAWDAQGRMQLQLSVVRRSQLDKELMLVGVKDHLELWNRGEWLEHSENLLRERATIAERRRQQAKPPAL